MGCLQCDADLLAVPVKQRRKEFHWITTKILLKCARFLITYIKSNLDKISGEMKRIDFAFNDADIIEERTLISVIGRQRLQGVESIIQEKNILKAAENLVFIVIEKQYKSGLEGSIPFNWMETAEEIEDLFLVWGRPSIGHAGPTGGDFPLITREGHNVLDVIFTSPILNLGPLLLPAVEVANTLDNIDGVVDHGVISKIPYVIPLVEIKANDAYGLKAPLYVLEARNILRIIWLSVLNRGFAWASDGPTHLITSCKVFDNYRDLLYDF
ncbi:hypothetical protein HYC85_018943 [Camellia sinensis]|uniref:Uncharacterized protein n=1 Tax=Camellia sinensis TaxID=4442 RepID=A0A7J7GZF8_CAMSI|nr:hypothetical protein HYC85_018943 [Camellia sinensis]